MKGTRNERISRRWRRFAEMLQWERRWPSGLAANRFLCRMIDNHAAAVDRVYMRDQLQLLSPTEYANWDRAWWSKGGAGEERILACLLLAEMAEVSDDQ